MLREDPFLTEDPILTLTGSLATKTSLKEHSCFRATRHRAATAGKAALKLVGHRYAEQRGRNRWAYWFM